MLLSVVTMCAKNPETCHVAPDVVSSAGDIDAVRADLVRDLWTTCGWDYAGKVLAWFETGRDTPGVVTNHDGSVDVWSFEAN